MSFNEETFLNLKTVPNTLFNHLTSIRNHLPSSLQNPLQEIDILQNFVNSLHKLGLTFERSLFKASQDFQHSMKTHVKDEKLCELYQLVINSLLNYADKLQSTFKTLIAHTRSLQTSEANFRNAVSRIRSGLKSDVGLLGDRISDYERCYDSYIFAYSSHANGGRVSGAEVAALEQMSLNKHDRLEQLLIRNATEMYEKLSDTAELEREIKKKIKGAALGIIETLNPAKIETVKKKVEGKEEFRVYFGELAREMSLNFSGGVGLKGFGFRFCDFGTFRKLDGLYDAPYTRFLFKKIQENDRKISPKVKFYVELLCDRLYKHDIEFDSPVIDEIHFLITSEYLSKYFIYSLIHKKTVLLLEKPFGSLELTKSQTKNLMQIAQFFFLICANNDRVDLEVIYHFMKFSLTVFSPHKTCLLEMLNKTLIINDSNFWLSLLFFFSEYLKPSRKLKNDGSPGNSNLIGGLKSIISNLTTGQNQGRNQVAEKAFEEVSFLIFKTNLDFETITDILMYLATKTEISLENVRTLLQKNQDLFLAQIRQSKEHIKDYRKKSISEKSKNKEARLFFAIRKSVVFLSNVPHIISLIRLNREFFLNREKLFRQILFRINIQDKNVRKKLILARTRTVEDKDYLLRDLSKSQIDPIITLDVKRTFCDNHSFDHKGLHLILANIGHEEMGSFAYYQGLNYIISYFLLLFDNDHLLTYNFAVDLLQTHFTAYVDKDLNNLRKLFFFLKRLIKIYLPVLSSFLENEQKLDTDIIFASWCLTLFTTITQYYPQYDLLDQIIDIFLAKGWPGFFQIVLVIFEGLQDIIFKLKYEEILVLLTDLPKNGFEKLISQHNKANVNNPKRFNFKEKIRKFNSVNKTQIAFFSGEFYDMQGRVEEFWFRISKKIKQKKKSKTKKKDII